MKKIVSMVALVAMGAILAGCSKQQDSSLPEIRQEENQVTLSTTVGLGEPASKALTAAGVKTFEAGDKLAVIYQGTDGKTHYAESVPLEAEDLSNADKTAKFTVTLSGPKAGGKLRYVYPASFGNPAIEGTGEPVTGDYSIKQYTPLDNQDGTIASLSSSLDLTIFDGDLTGEATLPASATLANMLTICAFTLKNSDGSSEITSDIVILIIEDGTHTYRVDRSAGAGPIYVAMQPTSSADITYTAYTSTQMYSKYVTGKTYKAGEINQLGLRMAPTVSLSTLSSNYEAPTGVVLTGTLTNKVQISIADGATVTLRNANINGSGTWTDGNCAGITPLGTATIILEGTNTVKSYGSYKPGIFVPAGKTLTMQGSGTLTVSGDHYGAGIGGGHSLSCGNIIINGGTIVATPGDDGAGIGSGYNASCGTISVSGGNITATGGTGNGAGIGSGWRGSCGDITLSGGTITAGTTENGAAIGSGAQASCGDITITNGVTKVTATKGDYSPSDCIGAGSGDGTYPSSCGTITIGGVTTGPITTSPYIYPAP